MAVPPEIAEQEKRRFLARIAQLRATPEERARIAAEGRPFHFDEWLREAGPPVPEEIAEMEEFLREREEERRRSLANEEGGRSQGE